MSKGKDSKKRGFNKPRKTLKEKKQEKKDKRQKKQNESGSGLPS